MSAVTINDRLSKTLKEFLLPELRKNYYLLSKKPLLRFLGYGVDEVPSKGTGTSEADTPRIQNIEQVDSAYKFEVVHATDAFGGGTYAQAIGATLRPGKFQASRSNATVKFITQSMEIPVQVIHASRSPELSIVKEVATNLQGAMHTMHSEMNRMFFAPTTHALAIVDGASAGTTITLQTSTAGTNETTPTKYLQIGDTLLIGTTAQIEAGTADTVVVASITSATVFEATAAVTVADNDVVARADVYDTTNSVYTDITSLASLVNNTGTVQGVNKATNFWFQSNVTDAAGALTLAQINNLANNTREFSMNPGERFLIGNQTQWNRYSALLTSTKTLFADTYKGRLAGGTDGLVFYSPDGGLPFFIDNDVEDGKIYLIDPNGLAWCNFRPFGPADDALMMDGAPAQRKSGTLNYEFAMWVGGQLAQTNARGSGVITGITA